MRLAWDEMVLPSLGDALKNIFSAALLLALASACAPTETRAIPDACKKNGVTASDPSICPRVSPIVLEPSATGERKSFSFELTNYSTSADLKIDSVAFTDDAAGVFSNPQVAPTTVKAQDQAVCQFDYLQNDLTEKHGKLLIKSNAKNIPELEIEVVILAGVVRQDAGSTTQADAAVAADAAGSAPDAAMATVDAGMPDAAAATADAG